MTSPTPPFRINRFVWLLLGIIVVALLLYQLRGALIPFIVGGALAYIFDPAVSWLDRRIPWLNDRHELKRIILILIMFLVGALVVAGILLVVIPTIITEIGLFIDALPDLIRQSRTTVEGWSDRISENIPVEMRAFVQDSTLSVGDILVNAARDFAGRTLGVVSRTLSVVIGLAAVPLFLFYILKDRERIIEGILDTMPSEPRLHTRNIIYILNRVFSSYVRAQLLLGVVVGVMVFICLTLLRVPFAPRARPRRGHLRAHPNHRPLARRNPPA